VGRRVLAALFALVCHAAHAQMPVTIEESSAISFRIPAHQTRVIEDADGSLTVDQLASPGNALHPVDQLTDLRTNRFYWIRVRLKNAGKLDRQLIIDKLPNWEQFTAHIVHADGSIVVLDKNPSAYVSIPNFAKDHDLVRSRSDEFITRYAQFDLRRGEEITLLARVKATHVFKHPDLSLSIADYAQYLEIKRQSLYFEGTLLGVILSMLMFSLYNALILRDRTSISYAGWLLASSALPLVLSMLDGQRLPEFFMDVRGRQVLGVDIERFSVLAFGSLHVVAYIIFSTLFLDIRRRYPSVFKALVAFTAFNVGVVAVQLWVDYDFSANLIWGPYYTLHIGLMLLVLYCGLREAARGTTGAAYFSLALCPYIVFRIFYALGIVKWWSPLALLPDTGLSFFLKNSAGIQQVLSIAFEAVIMSFAVAGRTKSLQDAMNRTLENQKNLIELQNHTLERTVSERTAELESKRLGIQELLHNMMPSSIAHELEATGTTRPVRHDSVTILFTDFVGFTHAASVMPANRMVAELNEIFGNFDRITAECGVEKIKTIGDAYMAVAGAPVSCTDHAQRCTRAGQKMLAYIRDRNTTATFKWALRVGIHTGPVVAGVIGTKRIAFDIWGDSVNVASRMESASEPDRINISAYTYDLIRQEIACEYRGKIPVKGKGEMDMYFVRS
jgi:class 3 adenylate cyclase